VRIAALPVVILAGFFTAAVSADAPADPAPPQTERALRARLEAFNKLLISEKYREAEKYVLPESRESYFTAEKPRIFDFQVTKIDWEDHFKTATVEMVSNVIARRPVVGSFKMNTSYYSHWKYVNGAWWFFYPQVMERHTPFGVMKVNPTLAQESGLDLQQEMAKGKAEMAAARSKTFAVDRQSVTLPAKDSSQSVILSNLLPGPIRLGFQRTSGSGFDVILIGGELAPKATAELKIYRSNHAKGDFKPGVVIVRAFPTGQQMSISVN
jgi:hypothetical protein